MYEKDPQQRSQFWKEHDGAYEFLMHVILCKICAALRQHFIRAVSFNYLSFRLET